MLELAAIIVVVILAFGGGLVIYANLTDHWLRAKAISSLSPTAKEKLKELEDAGFPWETALALLGSAENQ